MPRNPYEPTKEDKRAVFQSSMWYEIVYTFGVPRHDPYDYCIWEAINLNRLAHARVLYNFLETKEEKRSKDDVLAVDFDYTAVPIALSEDAHLRLNKDLFHFTYSRNRHTRETKCWPDSILSNLLEPVLNFMRHILDNKQDLFWNSDELASWKDLIVKLESGRELLINSSIESNGNARYQLALGHPLPGGKPVLTQCLPQK